MTSAAPAELARGGRGGGRRAGARLGGSVARDDSFELCADPAHRIEHFTRRLIDHIVRLLLLLLRLRRVADGGGGGLELVHVHTQALQRRLAHVALDVERERRHVGEYLCGGGSVGVAGSR